MGDKLEGVEEGIKEYINEEIKEDIKNLKTFLKAHFKPLCRATKPKRKRNKTKKFSIKGEK